MNDIALTIATVIEEQRFVTKEIARSAQEAAKGTDVISRSMTIVNSAINETDTAVSLLMGASTELAQQSTARIRAA